MCLDKIQLQLFLQYILYLINHQLLNLVEFQVHQNHQKDNYFDKVKKLKVGSLRYHKHVQIQN